MNNNKILLEFRTYLEKRLINSKKMLSGFDEIEAARIEGSESELESIIDHLNYILSLEQV